MNDSLTIVHAFRTVFFEGNAQPAFVLILKALNGIFIVALLVFIILILFRLRKPDHGFNREAIQGILVPLCLATVSWAVAYALDVWFPRHFDPIRIAKSYLNWVATSGFFWAGWTLLGLEDRIHIRLPSVTRKGITLPRLHRLAKSSVWLALYLIIGFLALTALLASQNYVSTSATNPSDICEAVINSIGMLVLSLGFLRELNRNEKDAVSMITATSLIIYGLIQPLALIQELLIPLYALAIVLKWSFLIGIVGFSYVGREAWRTRRQLSLDFAEMQARVLAASRSARHKLKNICWEMSVRLKHVFLDLPNLTEKEKGEFAEIKSLLIAFEQAASNLLSRTEVEAEIEQATAEQILERVVGLLDGLRGSRVVIGKIESKSDFMPHYEMVEALSRIVENGAQSGAKRVKLSNRHHQRSVVFSIENDGPPISEDGCDRLFNSRKGGFWAARRIITNFGGRIELKKSDMSGTVFEIYLPDDWNSHD